MNKQQWQNRIDELEKELAELKANPPKREPGERWEPGIGGRYWFIQKDGFISRDVRINAGIENEMLNYCNVFETEEEADFQAERTQVMRELDLWAVDRLTPNEITYGIFCDQDGEVLVTSWFDIYTSHVFESEEIAKKAIKAIGEERLKKYYFRVGD